MNKVKFNLNKPKDPSSLIMLVYRYSGGKLMMSTGIKIPTEHWNQTRQEIRKVRGKFDYPHYNEVLRRTERALKTVEEKYSAQERVPTILELKEGIRNILNDRGATKSNPFVMNYLKGFIKHKEEQGILKKGTIQGYQQLLKVLRSFKEGRILQFKDLSLMRLDNLTKHMVENHAYSTNQINKIQRRLNTVVRSAASEGHKINPAFKEGNWRVKVSNINDSGIALTEDELTKIRSIEVSDKLDKIRDRFLIGINTGQRYSDFSKLSIENVVEKHGKKFLDIIQCKTGSVVKIPVNETIQAIFDKYDGYPPIFSEQKFNIYLKELCKEAELNDEIIIRKENPIGGIVSEVRKPKHEVISSHDCRRSFATILHNRGVPPAVIMKYTGHKNLKTFSNYLKIDLSSERLIEQIDII